MAESLMLVRFVAAGIVRQQREDHEQARKNPVDGGPKDERLYFERLEWLRRRQAILKSHGLL